ncbi:DUF6421 family protein [Microbacterium sp. SORGH_AS_0888]|uniref:DUF6421 family protein n=1 Tax=Microbacterium sp. SORGH_AS_0888 TaxID=3041791 RepID=UPI0027886023|nr:DUF6421 family protein [Microbacterium sp. SORGH_AS_0888]MDQ1129405.1 hypothetical protein [Microbacterium sp. SORGH_AS_0888]
MTTLLPLETPAATDPAWLTLKAEVTAFQQLQASDGSVPEATDRARAHLDTIIGAVAELSPRFPHDRAYLDAVVADLERWRDGGLGIPDFHDALAAFRPERSRIDGLMHLVVFPMYTQNGSRDRHLEAVLTEVIWPEEIERLEADYANPQFVSLRLIDFTPGYDSDSAVLFPETVSVREAPAFTWGAIFQDREAARYRRVVRAAAEATGLELPERTRRMLDDASLAEGAFVMWDLIHDRSHMRGDLPFDPFMIKQRMPYFLYALEELRCDLTAYRECVAIERRLRARPDAGDAADAALLEGAGLVQDAVLFDRIFRFALTGPRVRNYDGLGGQLLFSWLHRGGVLHWTDSRLRLDWDAVPAAVMALGEAIDRLYWESIDRPKTAHWLAAYELVRSVVTPHPASRWAQGLPDEVLAGPPSGYTDAVLDDEFPLSMFHEALDRTLRPVIASTRGIRAAPTAQALPGLAPTALTPSSRNGATDS